MSKSSDEADRLTSEEFVDLIPHLPFENILQIEFLSTGWKKLIPIVDVGKRLYRCNLCNSILSGCKSVLSHISGKKHLGNMTMAKFFYHPEYTFTKAQLQKVCETKESTSNKISEFSENSKSSFSQERSNMKPAVSQSKNNNEKINTKHLESSSNFLQKNNEIHKKESTTNLNKTNKDGGNNSENNKPLLRLVPIKELKKNAETESNHIQNTLTVNLKNSVTGKTGINLQKKTNECTSVQNTKTVIKKSDQNSVEIIDKICINKTLDELDNKNEQQLKNTSVQKQNEDQNGLINDSSTDKKKHEHHNNKPYKTIEKLNYVASTNKEESRKLVKNPLATRQNYESASAEKPGIGVVNSNTLVDVIIIEDNEEESQSKSNFYNKNASKKTQVPAKNIEVVSPKSDVCRQAANIKNTSAINPNLVVIPTKRKLSPAKNKEVIADDPIFAVKSFSSIDSSNFCGLVGVEYVIKVSRNSIPVKYECGLCELVLGAESMQNHLLGYSHRLKFCEKHFPTAIQQFRQYIVNVPSDEHYKVMIPVLQKLTAAIEEHHGRSLPYECEEHRYNVERHRVLTEVFGRRHASEQRGPTFTHVIDSKQVDEFISKKDSTKLQPNSNKITFDRIVPDDIATHNTNKQIKRYNPPKGFSHNRNSFQVETMQRNHLFQSEIHPFYVDNTYIDDETHKRMVENFLKANQNTNFPQHKSSRFDRNEKELRTFQPTKRSRSPHRATLNIWDSYCRLVDNKLKILKEQFQRYRSNPESHPSYKDEWLKFWQCRKNDLLAVGKDYRTYDFQPDWVPFFNNRINELYDESFEKLKIEARKELSLPMTNDCLGDPKYFVHVKSDNYSPAIKKMAPNDRTSSSYNPNSILTSLPYTSGKSNDNINEGNIMANSKEIEIRDDSAPTVISVLRLLTALEEYLGSLGPKVVELLSKALQTEKSNQGRAQIVLTEENCTMLETAMEKFKGLVIARILDSPKERALKKAISKVNALLECTRELKGKHSSIEKTEKDRILFKHNSLFNIDFKTSDENPNQNVNEKLKKALQSVSNANDISKVIHLIEEKIAASLKAQGRTDIDRENIEQLAAVCVLLEKKKREAAGTTENKDIKQSLPQPLSDTLKKIVGNISTSSFEHRYNVRQDEAKHISTTSENQGTLASRLVTGCKNRTSTHNAILHPYQNTDELDNLVNNSTSQGNFSNSYSLNNNEPRMSDGFSFGTNSQFPQWLQQQNNRNIPPSLGWSQNSGRLWNANETTSTIDPSLQRSSYQGFNKKPPVQERFRYT